VGKGEGYRNQNQQKKARSVRREVFPQDYQTRWNRGPVWLQDYNDAEKSGEQAGIMNKA